MVAGSSTSELQAKFVCKNIPIEGISQIVTNTDENGNTSNTTNSTNNTSSTNTTNSTSNTSKNTTNTANTAK